MKRLFLLASAVLVLALASIQATAAVSLSLLPQHPQVPVNGQIQFVATVSGTTDSVVIWSVTGTGCSGITCGTVSDDGLYTAPANAPSPSNVTVTATSLADVTVTATSVITVGSSSTVSVEVSPAQAVLATGGSSSFPPKLPVLRTRQ